MNQKCKHGGNVSTAKSLLTNNDEIDFEFLQKEFSKKPCYKIKQDLEFDLMSEKNKNIFIDFLYEIQLSISMNSYNVSHEKITVKFEQEKSKQVITNSLFFLGS